MTTNMAITRYPLFAALLLTWSLPTLACSYSDYYDEMYEYTGQQAAPGSKQWQQIDVLKKRLEENEKISGPTYVSIEVDGYAYQPGQPKQYNAALAYKRAHLLGQAMLQRGIIAKAESIDNYNKIHSLEAEKTKNYPNHPINGVVVTTTLVPNKNPCSRIGTDFIPPAPAK